MTCSIKMWARTDTWCPQLESTTKIEDIGEVKHLTAIEAEYVNVNKVCANFKIVGRFEISEQMCPPTTDQGDVRAGGSRYPLQESSQDITEDVKYNRFKIKKESHKARNEDTTVVLQDNVGTDHKRLVYQGPLHYKVTSTPTNSDNFVHAYNLADKLRKSMSPEKRI